MATVERRAPAAASSWEPKAAKTPVTNGAANGSAAREQYTDHPSATTGSGTGIQLLVFCSRDLCVMFLWFGITCAWAGAGSDKKLMMCFESCDSCSCS